MNVFLDHALLAPVPMEHLPSGAPVASRTGFVAFGSKKWELFRALEKKRGNAEVLALIYQSREGDLAGPGFVVRWSAWYTGCEETDTGAHSMGMMHRPPTTASCGSVPNSGPHFGSGEEIEMTSELFGGRGPDRRRSGPLLGGQMSF